MDSTALAVLVGAVVAGAGGLLVPGLIGRVPPWEPEPAEQDGTVEADVPADAPEPTHP